MDERYESASDEESAEAYETRRERMSEMEAHFLNGGDNDNDGAPTFAEELTGQRSPSHASPGPPLMVRAESNNSVEDSFFEAMQTDVAMVVTPKPVELDGDLMDEFSKAGFDSDTSPPPSDHRQSITPPPEPAQNQTDRSMPPGHLPRQYSKPDLFVVDSVDVHDLEQPIIPDTDEEEEDEDAEEEDHGEDDDELTTDDILLEQSHQLEGDFIDESVTHTRGQASTVIHMGDTGVPIGIEDETENNPQLSRSSVEEDTSEAAEHKADPDTGGNWTVLQERWCYGGQHIAIDRESGDLMTKVTTRGGWNSCFGSCIVGPHMFVADGSNGFAVEWVLRIEKVMGRNNDVVVGISGDMDASHADGNFTRYEDGYGVDNCGYVYNRQQKNLSVDKKCTFAESDFVTIFLDYRDSEYWQLSFKKNDDETLTPIFSNIAPGEYRLATSLWTAANAVSVYSCRIIGSQQAKITKLIDFNAEDEEIRKKLDDKQRQKELMKARGRGRALSELRNQLGKVKQDAESKAKQLKTFQTKHEEYEQRIQDLETTLAEKEEKLARFGRMDESDDDDDVVVNVNDNDKNDKNNSMSVDEQTRFVRENEKLRKELLDVTERAEKSEESRDDLQRLLNQTVQSKMKLIEVSTVEINRLRSLIQQLGKHSLYVSFPNKFRNGLSATPDSEMSTECKDPS